MISYREITEKKIRTITSPDRHVFLPRLTHAEFGTDEHEQWVMENHWMVDYHVFMDDKEKAVELSHQLEQAFLADEKEDLQIILEQLKSLRVKPYEQLLPIEVWTRHAYQLAEYAGGGEVRHAITQKLGRYKGAVLEAMCGHTTYFADAPERKVIALDYCLQSLERHPCPHWRRIQCDLNQVTETDTLPFFKEGELDAVSICFGFKYPERIEHLVREFKRILRQGGFLSFIENPCSHYEQLCKRQFVPKHAREILLDAGYRSVTIKKLKVRSSYSYSGNFYHVEAVK